MKSQNAHISQNVQKLKYRSSHTCVCPTQNTTTIMTITATNRWWRSSETKYLGIAFLELINSSNNIARISKCAIIVKNSAPRIFWSSAAIESAAKDKDRSANSPTISQMMALFTLRRCSKIEETTNIWLSAKSIFAFTASKISSTAKHSTIKSVLSVSTLVSATHVCEKRCSRSWLICTYKSEETPPSSKPRNKWSRLYESRQNRTKMCLWVSLRAIWASRKTPINQR